MQRFDVIVIGCGPGGERAAIYAARAGKDVAVIEQHHVVGGTRVNWGTIPSKTLRESALQVKELRQERAAGIRCTIEGPLTVADFMYHEKHVVQRELELINQALERNRIEVFRGRGRFVDARTVAVIGVDGQTRVRLVADTIVIATGTRPNHPAHVPFDDRVVFDAHTILGLQQIPRSLIVVGAGVIGVEYGAIFSALGVEVTLVDARAHLLPYLDREIAQILEREMHRGGAVVLHEEEVAAYEVMPGEHPRVRCTTAGGNVLEADALLYAAGRDGNTVDLGLDLLGITPDARGLLAVDDDYRLPQQPHIYAVGDVIGYPALASTSMEQGRRSMRHAFDLPGPRGHAPEKLPFAIYAIPEVSYIGETEEQVRARGVDAIIGRGRYAMNPRGQIVGDTGGLLKLVFDEDLNLLGVHIVGRSASEFVHTGQAWLRMGARALEIAESLFNYPTLSDLYRHAALEALALHARRGGATSDAGLAE